MYKKYVKQLIFYRFYGLKAIADFAFQQFKFGYLPLWLLCGFIVGCYAFVKSPITINIFWVISPLLLSIILLYFLNIAWRLVMLLWIFILCGMLYSQLYSYIHSYDKPADLAFKQRIYGVVSDIEIRPRQKQKLIIKPVKINQQDIEFGSWFVQISALSSQIPERIHIGDYIDIDAYFYRDYGAVFPHGVDFSLRRWQQKVIASGRLLKMHHYQPTRIQNLTLSQQLYRMINDTRHHIYDVIAHHIYDDDAQAIITALTTGIRADINDDLRQSFINTGLMHILSISGLHMAIIALCSYQAIRWLLSRSSHLCLRYPIKQIAVFLSLPFIVIYALLSGFSIPTQRALIMIMIVFLAILCQRPALSYRQLAIAGFIIISWSPFAAVNASFQLSFAAMLGLILVINKKRDDIIYKKPTMISYGWNIIRVTFVATITTAPFTLYHFGYMSFYSIIGNMVAIPFITMIYMPYIMVYLLTVLLSIDITIFHYIAEYSSLFLLFLISHIADLPPINIVGLFHIPYAFIILLCSVIALFFLRGLKKIIALLGIIFAIIGWQNAPLYDVVIADDRKTIYYLNHQQEKLHIMRYRDGRLINVRKISFIDRLIADYYHLTPDIAKIAVCHHGHCTVTTHHHKKIMITMNGQMPYHNHDMVVVMAYQDDIGDDISSDNIITYRDIHHYGAHGIIFNDDGSIITDTAINKNHRRIWHTR